jgi:hypothetical protein
MSGLLDNEPGSKATVKKEILMFNVFTGEIETPTLLKGSRHTRFGFELNPTTLKDEVLNYLPICLDFIPRYDIEGNYLGYTHNTIDDKIIKPIDTRISIDKRIKTSMRNWKLIGAITIILIEITLLLIHYNIGYNRINEGSLLVQFVILIVFIIYFVKLQKRKKELYGAT